MKPSWNGSSLLYLFQKSIVFWFFKLSNWNFPIFQSCNPNLSDRERFPVLSWIWNILPFLGHFFTHRLGVVSRYYENIEIKSNIFQRSFLLVLFHVFLVFVFRKQSILCVFCWTFVEFMSSIDVWYCSGIISRDSFLSWRYRFIHQNQTFSLQPYLSNNENQKRFFSLFKLKFSRYKSGENRFFVSDL